VSTRGPAGFPALMRGPGEPGFRVWLAQAIVQVMMKTIAVDAARTRYVIPFSRLARAVGVALMASGPLFLLGVVMAAAPTPVLYLTAAASALDVLIGLVLFTGARHVEVDRESRQLRFGATVLGLALPATGQQIPVDTQAKLIVSAAHRERATHDVSLEQHGQRARVLSFAKRDQAQRYAQQLADALRIAVITMDAGTGDA